MNKPTILVIDDEQELCLLLVNFLSKKSSGIDYANTLEAGRSKFNEMMPDILILDHNLPDGYGLDNIEKFKSLNQKLTLIIISAMSNLRQEALNRGADHFIEKPISFRQLNAILDEAGSAL